MLVNIDRCTGCAFCMRDCPVEAIKIKKKKAVINYEQCVFCNVCLRVCQEEAITRSPEQPTQSVECDACPIKCWIPKGFSGACQRYQNAAGKILRMDSLHHYDDVSEIVGPRPAIAIQEPLITGIGAGTTYPCCKPAPHIVTDRRNDVDVVTVVTEVPLSYSSVILKIDTDVNIGKEGDRISVGKREVGMVENEQYGSKMLHIGGVNRLTGENGFLIAKTITEIANRKSVKLKIENGSRIKAQVGKAPIIDGKEASKMRVGCGSAALGIFTPILKAVADDAIILDAHITGLMSQHVAGKYAGVKSTGVCLKFRQSTPGRYFGDHGPGWGGTSITNPIDVIKSIDMTIARVGMKILITETTGQNSALFEVLENGELRNIPLTQQAQLVMNTIQDSCEPSLVSAIYTAGSGGSARAGVTKYPIKLTQAVHSAKASLTVGGAPCFVLPGGGITFMVDVERVKTGSFYWTPTPATICPVEYTMVCQDYEAIGGHVEAMKPFDSLKPIEAKNHD
jgi:6-hydroxynicotinate reductase